MIEHCLFVWAIRTSQIHAPVVEHKLIFAKNIVNFDRISDESWILATFRRDFGFRTLLYRLEKRVPSSLIAPTCSVDRKSSRLYISYVLTHKLIIPWRILFHYWFQSLDFNISYHLKMWKLIFYMYWPFILIGRQVMPSSSRWNFTKRSLSPDLIWVIRVISWFRLSRSVRKVTWCELFPYSFWR